MKTSIEKMQDMILHDFADLAEEMGMDDIAEKLREHAGEDSR